MSDEPITCKYLFTLDEYGKSLGGYWRMVRWWYLGIAAIFLILPTVTFLYPDPTPPGETPQPLVWAIVYDYLPPVLVITFLWVFLRWRMRGVFAKGPVCGRELSYTVRDRSLYVVNPLMQAEYTWESFAHAGETPRGFYLFLLGRKSYQWLPHRGFTTPDDINRCRDLLREKIRKFQEAS